MIGSRLRDRNIVVVKVILMVIVIAIVVELIEPLGNAPECFKGASGTAAGTQLSKWLHLARLNRTSASQPLNPKPLALNPKP